MKTNTTWKEIMNSHTIQRAQMKAPALVAVIVALHVSAVGAFIFIQGCGTTQPSRPAGVTPPPPPTMPPRGMAMPPPRATPSFQPPVASEPAPAAITQDLQTYTIRPGDSLGKIASRFGVSAREIAELNQIANPNLIKVNQQIILPPHARNVPAAQSSASAPRPAASAPAVSAGPGTTHTVTSGETLARIGSKYGVSAKRIAEANSIANPNVIRVGQKLVIPGAAASSTPAVSASAPAPAPLAPPAPAPAMADIPVAAEPIPALVPVAPVAPAAAPQADDVFPYEVMEGETLDDIARNFAVLKNDILRYNNLSSDAQVKPGMVIKIPPSTF